MGLRFLRDLKVSFEFNRVPGRVRFKARGLAPLRLWGLRFRGLHAALRFRV